MPKFLSYVYPLHRSNDGRIARLLGQWIDRRSMERSVYISCSHNPIHIKLWSFYLQGGQKAILIKEYCSGPRRRLPWRDLPSHEATRRAAGGRWWQCEGFQWELSWFLSPWLYHCFKPSFRICIKPPPPCPPSHNMWKNIEMQNQPLSKLVKLGESYQLVPKCSESQSEYSS